MENMKETIEKRLLESARIKQAMAESIVAAIQDMVQCVINTLRADCKLILCGNGGSAADCQHIAAEFVGRFQEDRQGMPAIALTTDTSILTSVSNDYGFKEIFQRQVEAIGKAGDVLIGISTSGSSENVHLAMQKAKSMGMKTIAFVGSAKGSITDLADFVIQVPSDNTARIQEGHITIAHILCELVEIAIIKSY